MNTGCPPKCVPSAARFFTLCRLTVQPPQSYSVGGHRSSGQLTGKPAGARPDYRGRWCTDKTSGLPAEYCIYRLTLQRIAQVSFKRQERQHVQATCQHGDSHSCLNPVHGGKEP
ncbi:UNVERIFIED_CONTAM: hypothetical protein FKN15_036822 [Acipenser sinensis]